jgi:proline iminopeptidase
VSERVALDGGRVASFTVVGSGPPMLYFEGGPGLAADLAIPDAELFAERFEIYLIDPHGSGESTAPEDPSAYDHLGHARFYDEARRALGIDRATIGGISFGGCVALTYCARYPDVAERCIAISAAAMGEDVGGPEWEEEFERNLSRHAGAPWYPQARRAMDEWTDRVLAATTAEEVDELFRLVLPLYYAEPDRSDVRAHIRWVQERTRSDLAATKAWESGLYQTIDIRPLLADVRCPALVVVGEEDFICGPAQGRVIAGLLPAATYMAISGCGHFPAHERPDQLRAVVLDWCDRQPV